MVGGGVIGSAAAWALARRGVAVVLLEQFGPGHTLGASHGSARIYRSSYAQPHHQALVAEARALWAELEEESGVRVLHPAPGVTTAARAGLPRLREIAAAMTAAGVPHEWLSAGEAEQRWPGMRFPGPVLFEPATAGRVDADTAVTALQGAAAGAGAVVRHHRRVTAVEADGDGVLVRSAAGAAVRARPAVVAAGAWTAHVLPGLSLPPLRVTRNGRRTSDRWTTRRVARAHGRPDPAEGWPGRVDGRATPRTGRLAALPTCVRRWWPGLAAGGRADLGHRHQHTHGGCLLIRLRPVVVPPARGQGSRRLPPRPGAGRPRRRSPTDGGLSPHGRQLTPDGDLRCRCEPRLPSPSRYDPAGPAVTPGGTVLGHGAQCSASRPSLTR